MTLKTKAFGFVAATALTLSAATGAMAVDGDTTAILNPKNDGQCYASAATGEINLGTWEWDGDSYVLQSGNAGTDTITFKVTQDKRPTNTDCAIGVTVSDLTNQTNNTYLIDDALITLGVVSGSGSTGSPYTVVTPHGAGGTDLVLKATLATPPADRLEGTYKGTVTVSSVSASN